MIEQASDVVVAVSGGLDSAYASYLLKTAGWNVHGLHFLLPSSPSDMEARMKAAEDISGHLQIPLVIMDLREEFTRRVIEPFVQTYLKGLTPNPCVTCNELIKFVQLLKYAEGNNIHFIATGHYARLIRIQDGRIELLRGKDKGKDQSYFLHRLNLSLLSKAIFPLGDFTKQEARDWAHEFGLPVNSTPESQDICFLSKNNYRFFIEDQRGPDVNKKGKIINSSGKILGEHGGIYRYTIGQRHGLGIAASSPYYVKELRHNTNEVVIGIREDLFSTRVEAGRFNWIEGAPFGMVMMKASAQVRYRHKAVPGTLKVVSSNSVVFEFDEPQWGITPGQALVCYKEDRVIGGGWIG